jgi:hypothetical protein
LTIEPVRGRQAVPVPTSKSIQAAMGWDDDHLHQFRRARDILSESLRLDELVADMGDGWENRIQIEKQPPPDPGADYPRFVDGAMRCPLTRITRNGSIGTVVRSTPTTSTPTALTKNSPTSQPAGSAGRRRGGRR